MIIDACATVGATPEAFRAYLEPNLRSDYDAWVAKRAAGSSGAGRGGRLDSAEPALPATDNPSVLFPSRQPGLEPPFGVGNGSRGGSLSAWAGGARAYNRWLAEICRDRGDARVAGMALLPTHDVVSAVAEVERAQRDGLRGVVLPPIEDGDELPYYNDPRYEPLWSVCEANGLPIHCATGWPPPGYGGTGRAMLESYEAPEFALRTLPFLIWGGVLHRHPRLRFVLVDIAPARVALKLRTMEEQYSSDVMTLQARALAPHEYWERQCFLTTSNLDPISISYRRVLGISRCMWGSASPAQTSVHTAQASLRALDREGVAIESRNAARLYGLSC